MVTKRMAQTDQHLLGYILAKKHMVTKHTTAWTIDGKCYILAKKHMVTKPQIS